MAVATLVTICSAPVIVAIFSAAALRERLTPAIVAALACALAGTALLVGVGQPDAASQVDATMAGILLSLAAAGCFATFIMVSRVLAGRYHPLHSIAIAVSIAAALLVAFLAITARVQVAYPWTAWLLFLYLGLVPTALAYGLFFHGVKSATAAEASIAALAEPLTSAVLAVVIFRERLGPLGLVGAALLISVMAFLYRNGSSG